MVVNGIVPRIPNSPLMAIDVRTVEHWSASGALVALAVLCLVTALVVFLVARRR